MTKHAFLFEHSPIWIGLLVLLSAGFSYWLYSKKGLPWNKKKNLLLAMLRFFGVFLLLLLLLEPALRAIQNTVLKPTIHVLVDNSQSIEKRGMPTKQIMERIRETEDELNDMGFVTKRFTLNDSSNFSATSSNLSNFIKRTTSTQRDEHQVGSILISDGIYNQGVSPAYQNYIKPVFVLGVGDTIAPKDVSITRTQFNKVAYKANKTPIRVEITQSGYDERPVKVEIIEQGKTLAHKNIRLDRRVQEVDFLIENPFEGLRRLNISVTELAGETTYSNNLSSIFMEIIDGKRKVLIVAAAPHPDIKAIRATLSETGNYETELYIPSIQREKPVGTFDVVIYHGAFRTANVFSPKGNPGIWYILSNETNIRSLNSALPFLQITRKGSRPDKVTGSFNQNFSKFTVEESSAFEEFPPVEVPFGEYQVTVPAEILMYQKLGNFKTEKPLMVVFDDASSKIAVMMGQNIWPWKLQESAITGSSKQFDNLITKTVQYLSVSSQQKRFRLEPKERSFNETEPVSFDAEVYNDIFERIYGNEITLEITDEQEKTRNFSFFDSEINSSFQAPSLKPGIYRYKAEVVRGGKSYLEQGQFSVRDINVEALNLTADHQLLKTLAGKSGGKYAPLEKKDLVLEAINEREFQSLIKTEDSVEPLHRLWWWYLIIFLLFSTEWFLRKYWGAY